MSLMREIGFWYFITLMKRGRPILVFKLI